MSAPEAVERTEAPPGPARAPAADRAVPWRPFLYAALDLLFAGLFVWIGLGVARSTDGTFEIASLVAAVALAAAGIATSLRHPRAWWVAVGGCGLVIAMGLLLIALLAWSAGILSGTFGALGKAGALSSLGAAALAIEVYVLVPGLQLGYLLSARGRREAGRTGT